MQLLSATPSSWKNIIKQNNDINTFTTTENHFIRNSRVLTVQKVTSKELQARRNRRGLGGLQLPPDFC